MNDTAPYSPKSPMEKYYKKASETDSAPQKESPPSRLSSLFSWRPKNPALILRIAAIVIPLALILYILYWNFLPFGFAKTYTLMIGSLEDTTGQLYIEPARTLSDRRGAVSADGKPYTYRELSGSAYVIFKPKAVLKKADIDVSIQGDGVAIVPPTIDVDPDPSNWTDSWEMTEEIPPTLTGSPFVIDGCAYFDGSSILELPNSEDMYDEGPLSVYTEWKPEDAEHSNQQIVGHFNWEIYQNTDNVTFQVGRMNDRGGPFYEIKYPITSDFFGKKHSALATYLPSTDDNKGNGYIQLYVDGNFVDRVDIGKDIMLKDYGQKDLSLGWSEHNYKTNSHFKGCVYRLNISDQLVVDEVTDTKIRLGDNQARILLTNTSTPGQLRKVTINVND